ncbi:MAG: archaellin/type IV pilin N-terminal domain-containing protein [Candidatus Pacearchaeota archaeon]
MIKIGKLMKLKEGKKGVSPVVASLLLISLVVVLSSIVFIWAKGFIKEVILKNGMPAQQACEEIALSVTIVGNDLQITNDGNIPVYGFSILVKKADGTITPIEKEGESISPGSALSVSETSISEGTNIEVVPSILGESDGQRKIYKCEKTFVAQL